MDSLRSIDHVSGNFGVIKGSEFASIYLVADLVGKLGGVAHMATHFNGSTFNIHRHTDQKIAIINLLGIIL